MKTIALFLIFLMAVVAALVGVINPAAAVGYILSGNSLSLPAGVFALLLIVSVRHTSHPVFSLS